jgi:hypothetical protein
MVDIRQLIRRIHYLLGESFQGKMEHSTAGTKVKDKSPPRQLGLASPQIGCAALGERMPVRREGRFVSTSPAELNAWLGKESGKPVHAVNETTDLTAELKRGLSYIRHEQQSEKPQAQTKTRKKRK